MAGKTGLSLVATTATVTILFLLVLAVAGFLGTTVMTVEGGGLRTVVDPPDLAGAAL
jgi:hypothetical protein